MSHKYFQSLSGVAESADRAESERLVLDKVTTALCKPSVLNGLKDRATPLQPLPSTVSLQELMDRLRAALFPGYFTSPKATGSTLHYHMAANLDSIFRLLGEQLGAGLCFRCEDSRESCGDCHREGFQAALKFMETLPHIRDMLASDVMAAYEGDPAANSTGEIIFCYPSIRAMFHHRVAHELYQLGMPVIPRIIAEMAHATTGIDIHPGAAIGREFFVDHGTGVVIGETCVIGKSCRLYQGVTLGALSFPKNPDGSLIKGIPRHPILGDNVTVYAGATILGRVKIGDNAVIGGNVWITHDIPAGARISQERHAC